VAAEQPDDVAYVSIATDGDETTRTWRELERRSKCYRRLSGGAGLRQRANAPVGLACHSSPHFGGAIVNTAG
jgi:hypothetical protein